MVEAAKQVNGTSPVQTMPAAAVAAPPAEGKQVAEAGMPAANDAQFHPILLNRHAAKVGGAKALSTVRANFDLSSFVSYYPMLRLTGYSFGAGYSPINRALAKAHEAALKNITQKKYTSRKDKLLVRLYGDTSTAASGPTQDFGAVDIDHAGATLESATTKGATEKERYTRQFNKVESAAFMTLAAIHSVDAFKQLKENFKLAVAAELGKDQNDVTFSDLRKSNNPIVVSAVDRYMWQTPMRLVAGASFWKSLWLGIVANSIVISAERTIFYRPLSYDVLSKAVNDVQINGLGVEVKNELVDNLIRVLQAERFDHRLASIPREQVEALRPTLEMVADDVIGKRFGITGMLYIMGGGVLVPEDPGQSRVNFQHVREIGVSGVMEEAKKIKANHKTPSTRIWDARLAEKERGEGNIAESARREELLRERRAILARGPLHSVPGSSLDPDARYGGGVQMY